MLFQTTHEVTPENRSVIEEWRQLLGQGSGQQHPAALVELLAFHVSVHEIKPDCPSICGFAIRWDTPGPWHRLCREEFTSFSVSYNKNPCAEGPQLPTLREDLTKRSLSGILSVWSSSTLTPLCSYSLFHLKPIAHSLLSLGSNLPRPSSPLEETPRSCLVAVMSLVCSGWKHTELPKAERDG